MTDSNKEVVSAEAIESLRGIDLDDPQFLHKLIDLFLQDAPVQITEIEQGLVTKDALRLSHAAHTIKGSCSNFGATNLCKLASELEQLGKSSSFTAAESCLGSLKSEFSLVSQALRKIT